MQCPNCGVRIKFWTDARFQNGKEVPCPSCPAVLKAPELLGFVIIIGFFVVLVIVGVTAVLAISSMSTFPQAYAPNLGIVAFFIILSALVIALYVVSLIRVKKIEVVRLRPECQHCKTVMIVEDAEFCPNCGASMETPVWESITIVEEQPQTMKSTRRVRERKPTGICLVCGLELSSHDNLATCPHCRNVFHKTHLAEWVSKKKRCPACGERLYRSELKELHLHSEATKK
jgi:predicted RNA-binding Zn-ribbon protein involved in translation (DUF1610 family)